MSRAQGRKQHWEREGGTVGGVMIGHKMRMTRTGAGIDRWGQVDRETSDTGPRVEDTEGTYTEVKDKGRRE